jgi:hypothetical protein
MSDQVEEGEGRPFNANGADAAQWPQTPDALVYHLDAVLQLFDHVHQGQHVELVDALLDCVDWRGMFGSADSGFLRPQQVQQLRDYYRAKFATLEPFYLAEQLSTELMSALLASGDVRFSDALATFGRERPDLWQEIRAFFTRKELATSLLLVATQRGTR